MIPSLVPALIVILSLAGLANALYFTFAYYGRIRKVRWIPEILCAREDSNCVTVVQTPYARVLGVPNSLLGAIYYVILMVWVALSHLGANYSFLGIQNFPVHFSLLNILVAIAGLTVLLGFYLIYALISKLHTHCPLCYAGHAINALLFFLLLLVSAAPRA